ncbi:DUF6506 family protein [Lysobacter sp. 5GHs7-4]|uniref:DUF6506 family protein n=1 Tax=Lysobacter sp. 5GHs7-4 TaxID=2904253 RepID=UPI001E2DEADD|nr:DUF6506 family protein [Lysobacter sp. 5GHs7-4]UHQ22252.1 DUF6506 family protein [Lysobacter sp. 5GHs7-4]
MSDGEAALISWAFIFEAPQMDPAVDRMVIERGGVRTTIVGVPEQAAVVDVAVALVEDGAQFIELCGGFEPVWAGRVFDAIRACTTTAFRPCTNGWAASTRCSA